MTTSVTMPAATRSNVLTLQSLQQKIGASQNRLATGERITTALDNPPVYFASKGLNNRANDLMSLKDAMGQATSTVKAGSKGADSIQSLLTQAQGLTTAAMAAMGNDAASLATRKNLAERFDDILDAINGVVDDSSYKGKNLIKGDGKRIDATPESKLDVLKIPGVTNAQVTNVKEEDAYSIEVLGTGTITGNPKDISDTEQTHGIRPIIITGVQSSTQGNFEPITVEIKGPPGRDKQITVRNPPEVSTVTFTQEQWRTAKTSGAPLTYDHSFGSGVHIAFNVNFDQIESSEPNHGQGSAEIEKLVDIGLAITDSKNERVARLASNTSGHGKLTDGENAFDFGGGTVRLDIDQKTIAQALKPITPLWNPWGKGFNSSNVGLPIGSSLPTAPWSTGATVFPPENATSISVDYKTSGSPMSIYLVRPASSADGYSVGNILYGTNAPVLGNGTITVPWDATGVGRLDLVATSTAPGSLDYSFNANVKSASSGRLVTKQSACANNFNDLNVAFNTQNSADLTIGSSNIEVSGQGLQVDYSQNDWRDPTDIENAVKGLDTAEQRLRDASQTLSNGLNIITTRETFTKEFSDVLSEGAAKLTLLDQNEEGSNLLMLQTRQQLSMTALTLAAKSQQSILNLF